MGRYRWSLGRELLVVGVTASALVTGCLLGWSARGAGATVPAPYKSVAVDMQPVNARLAAIEARLAALAEEPPSVQTAPDGTIEGEVVVLETARAYPMIPPLLYLSATQIGSGVANVVFGDRIAHLQVGRRTDFEIDGRRCCLLLKSAGGGEARFFFRCRPAGAGAS